MVLVGVAKLGCTNFIFFDPGMKINGCYYHEVLLSQQHPRRYVTKMGRPQPSLIARLDDSKDEREWQGLATEAEMLKKISGIEGHYSVQWMGQARVEYLCALIRQALVLY